MLLQTAQMRFRAVVRLARSTSQVSPRDAIARENRQKSQNQPASGRAECIVSKHQSIAIGLLDRTSEERVQLHVGWVGEFNARQSNRFDGHLADGHPDLAQRGLDGCHSTQSGVAVALDDQRVAIQPSLHTRGHDVHEGEHALDGRSQIRCCLAR